MSVEDENAYVIPNFEEDLPGESKDPLYSYPYIEAALQGEPPQSQLNFAYLINDIAPHKHIKGTSKHSGDTTYYLSTEGIYRRYCSMLASSIIQGEDLEMDRQTHVFSAGRVLQNHGYEVKTVEDIERRCEEIALTPGQNVVEVLQEHIPYFNFLDKSLRVTLSNMVLAARLRSLASQDTDFIPFSTADLENQPPAPHRMNVVMRYQRVMEYIHDPQISALSKKNFGKMLELFGLHMPLKSTVQSKFLSWEGFIRENMQKIAEGLEAGEDPMAESLRCKYEVEKMLDQRPELGSAFDRMAFMQATNLKGITDTVLYTLPTYLLVKKMLSSSDMKKVNRPDLIQGSLLADLRY